MNERLLHIDDEEAAASNPPDADLGTIEVQMRNVAYYTENTSFYSGEDITEIGPVHEKSKKGGVHSVRRAFFLLLVLQSA